MVHDIIKNNLVKSYNNNRDYVLNEVSRLGSVEQRHTNYRRSGMLNFGARQMLSLTGDSEVYIIGVGGPPIVG